MAPEVPHPRPMRQDVRDAAAHASGRVMPRGFWSVLADSRRCGFNSSQFALNRANLGRIDLNWPYQAEIQKKKKKRCNTHRLSQILNPTFNSLHTNTSNKLSTSLSLHHSSLTLSLLSVDVSACCETLSQCRVSHLTHFNSFLLQLSLSLSHAFLTQVALNLSLIFDFNDL